MAVEAPEDDYFDGDFEFDAPQWMNFESEKDQLENDTNDDQYDWWFQKIHPLHSPNQNTPEPKPKNRPLRKSVLGIEGSKLSTEIGKSSLTSKFSLPGNKSSLASKSSLTSKSSLPGKTSLSNTKRESESRTSKGNSIDETNMTSSNQGDEVVKKPRKCWQLNGHSPLSFSPQCLSSLPKDLQPKRVSSNSSSNKTSLPARVSTELATSPLAPGTLSRKLGVKNKNLKTARRSCPQNLQKSKQAWNESSTCGSTKSKNVVVDEELQKIIEKHNSKFLSQQSEYDLNGRRIRKTASPVKHAKKENVKPAAATTVNQAVDMDVELREMITNHNRRIWTAQNSEYDLNGRRLRKGNATVVAPTAKTKPEAQRTPTKSKNLRRSNETNQKRKNPSKNSEVSSKLHETGCNTVESSTDFENEIQEIISLHNSRLAAKKAKK